MNEQTLDMIRPCDLYEWTLGQLEQGKLSLEDERLTLENLKSLQWLKDKFNNLSKPMAQYFYAGFLDDIQNLKHPPDIMSISFLYYQFTKVGIDTSAMREAVNVAGGLIMSGEYPD